jgi:polysaccharide export outer membrane protein
MRKSAFLITLIALFAGSASLSHAQETQGQKPEDSRQCVAVLGAVRAPGRFESKRRIRLLEAIAFAGGFTDQAEGTIAITNGGKWPQTIDRDTQRTAPELATRVSLYQKANINSTDEARNPYLEAGDIVTVYQAEAVFIIGAVVQPRQTFLKDTMTLTQAIAAAGGPTRGALIDRVRIIRESKNPGERIEIRIDLNKVRKKKMADPVLQPNDIIEVPPRFGMSGPLMPVRPIYDAPLPVRVIY